MRRQFSQFRHLVAHQESKTSAPNYSLIASFEYEKSLRTRSLSSLITELEMVKQEIKVTKKELADCVNQDVVRQLLNQSETLRSKVLAVEIEIGRRIRIPSKITR